MRNEAKGDNQSSLKTNKLAKDQKILNSTISWNSHVCCFVGHEEHHSNIFLTEGIHN
jgi:hypothetical protein